MNSHEQRLGRYWREGEAALTISAQFRPVISRGRRLENSVDVQQIHGTNLEQREGFWDFMVGYSAMGGPDLVG